MIASRPVNDLRHASAPGLPEANVGVRVSTGKITFPTYLPAAPDLNPMFLEKRVYQGSSGKVYPLPFTDRIAEKPVDRKWQAVWIENEFLRVLVLPELGGRIHAILDKTNGYDLIYNQPVELDAAARPRPGEADERGFDDTLVVDEVVAVRLVLQGVDAPAEFRQDERAEKFIFNPHRFPLPVNGFFSDAVGEGQGINLAAAALINTLLKEHRILVRCGG